VLIFGYIPPFPRRAIEVKEEKEKMKKHSYRILALMLAAAFTAGCATTPTEETKAAAETKPGAAPTPKAAMSYNVVRGDHLWGISSKPAIYGNPYQWPLIYKTNRDKIKDADLIQPGQVFAIDKTPSKGNVDAAIRHAKTRGAWQLGVVEESDKAYLAR
jgi:nucleoid-associated protein YgaU